MELKIIDIKDNVYSLQSETGENFEFKLKFFGLTDNPEIGDSIKMHEKLLDKTYKEFSRSYMFGPLDEPYGRKVKDENDVEVISLKLKNQTVVLKRFFG